MTQVRLIKHEAVPKCGSYEVRFADGRPSRYFYWDDIPGLYSFIFSGQLRTP
jgi:hypothetical protein